MKNKNKFPKVAGIIGFSSCDDLPEIHQQFGMTVASRIDTLIEYALYGYFMRRYTDDDMPNLTVHIFATVGYSTYSIYHLNTLIGVITWQHATINTPSILSYKANEKTNS